MRETTDPIIEKLKGICLRLNQGKNFKDFKKEFQQIEIDLECLQTNLDELLQNLPSNSNQLSFNEISESYEGWGHDETIEKMRHEGKHPRLMEHYNSCYFLSCAFWYLADANESESIGYIENAISHLELIDGFLDKGLIYGRYQINLKKENYHEPV